jgi:Flp pilus assembly pilin Flp
MRTTAGLLRQLVREERGQDVIEYALLSALIGVVGIVAWQNIGIGVGNAYSWWDAGVQDLSSCTPDPGGLGCGASGGS